jgi:CelD/BcsL family acetyltransferase involved in cellulose biosynthesis
MLTAPAATLEPLQPQVDCASPNAAASLELRVFPGRHLASELFHAWSEIQQSERALESPFFTPEYTQAIAAVRDDVHIAVAFRGEEPVAFFPFQRNAWNAGAPVGGPLTDYQGIVARAGIVLQPRELLQACGLASWRFDHLLAAQQQFAPFQFLVADSPGIDLSGGVEAYFKPRRKSNDIYHAQRMGRKIEREVGSVRLAHHACDRDLLDRLIAWKSQQYRETRTPNIFDYPWVRQVVERLLGRDDGRLQTTLVALYAGDKVVSILVGLRAGDVLHSWITTYNRDFARYSPGRQLYMELIKAAPEQGIRLIDLGRGKEPYKRVFANTSVPLWEGIVERRPVTRWLRKTWVQARERVRESRYAHVIRLPWSWIRPLRDRMKYR